MENIVGSSLFPLIMALISYTVIWHHHFHAAFLCEACSYIFHAVIVLVCPSGCHWTYQRGEFEVGGMDTQNYMRPHRALPYNCAMDPGDNANTSFRFVIRSIGTVWRRFQGTTTIYWNTLHCANYGYASNESISVEGE